jgi:hypothetical protein
MRSKPAITLFIASLVIIPAAYALAAGLAGPAYATLSVKVLFALTLIVELLALAQIVLARRLFSPSDPGRLTWTLILAFMSVRIVAEIRLATLTFDLVPRYSENASRELFFYVVVLRYLYTLSDLLFGGAILTIIRAYKNTGLKFELLARDYLYLLLVWAIPITTFIFRANLGLYGLIGPDRYIATYRLVAVFVGAFLVSLCLIVRRYALQMGGGAVARVWNTVAIAGTARAASFLALSLLLKPWQSGAQFLEQYLLWIFAGCWLIAALYQQEVVPRQIESPGITATAPEAERA